MNKTVTVLYDIEQLLFHSTRMGGEIDRPEGTRYIQISDTLTKILLERIKEARREMVQSAIHSSEYL